MELYVKRGQGDAERFEPIQATPSDQALQVMIDHDFIRKALPNASLVEVFDILNLTWSVIKAEGPTAKHKV